MANSDPVSEAEVSAADDPDVMREVVLEELAGLDDEAYENVRKARAAALGWRPRVLDEARQARRKKAPATDADAPPPPTIEELADAARDIIASKDVLELFGKHVSQRLAGEAKAAQILYLCATSRLFEKPMNLVIKGLSSIGKSHLRDRVLEYMPPGEVVNFTTTTEKGLIYLQDDLRHKILSMSEAVSTKSTEFQDYLLREIISNGSIDHLVPVAGGKGELATTMRVTKEGPIMFVTTTTRARLHPELETRILSIETDDSEKQTRAVLSKIAEIEGGLESHKPDLGPWHAYQRWLAVGERRVVVPYATEIAAHKDLYARSVRMRRDFHQVLTAIKVNAFLHREHRRRTDQGQIIASEVDYEVVYDLMAAQLARAAGTRLSRRDTDLLDAIHDLDEGSGVKVRDLVGALKVHQTSISRRLITLTAGGFVENTNPGRGKAGVYKCVGDPDGRGVLPDPDKLFEEG